MELHQMSFSLSHLGEQIVAEMASRKPQEVVDALRLRSPVDRSFVAAVDRLAYAEQPLAPHCGFIFDGASRVDVVFHVSPRLAVAAEVKLGATRLTKRRIDGEFLQNCRLTHKKKRLSGNMMAILDRRFGGHAEEDGLSIVLPCGPIPLAREWLIIARPATLRTWEGKGRPDFSPHVHCASISCLADAYGGKNAFNSLVREVLAFDFYDAWIRDI